MATDMITQSTAAPPTKPAGSAPKADVSVAALPGASKDQAVQQGASQSASSSELEAAVSQVADYVQNVQRNLSFSVDQDSGHTVVKVIDSDSEEVIRQIPSEELLALARRLRDMDSKDVKGVLVQSSA